jgi:hypothetical protein
MTVILNKKYDKLELKKIVINKINFLLKKYKSQFELESIHFNIPIDGIIYYRTFIHYSDEKFIVDFYSIKATTLLKILKCIKEKEFYGICRLSNNQTVKVIPKKYVN